MNSRIFKSDKGLAIPLPREALDPLGLDEGTEVSVHVDVERGEIILTPATSQPSSVDPEFARQLAGFIERYRPALEALAR